MKKSPWAMALLLGAFVGCSTTGGRPQAKSLFNGHDLAGWVVMYGGEWKVEDGVLVGRNGKDWSTNPAKSGSWLRTEKQYGDFILELDYAINDGGNSGLFIRSALEKNPAFTGHEMQILADYGRQPTKGSAGSLYDVIAATIAFFRLVEFAEIAEHISDLDMRKRQIALPARIHLIFYG